MNSSSAAARPAIERRHVANRPSPACPAGGAQHHRRIAAAVGAGDDVDAADTFAALLPPGDDDGPMRDLITEPHVRAGETIAVVKRLVALVFPMRGASR